MNFLFLFFKFSHFIFSALVWSSKRIFIRWSSRYCCLPCAYFHSCSFHWQRVSERSVCTLYEGAKTNKVCNCCSVRWLPGPDKQWRNMRWESVYLMQTLMFLEVAAGEMTRWTWNIKWVTKPFLSWLFVLCVLDCYFVVYTAIRGATCFKVLAII